MKLGKWKAVESFVYSDAPQFEGQYKIDGKGYCVAAAMTRMHVDLIALVPEMVEMLLRDVPRAVEEAELQTKIRQAMEQP